MPSPLDKYRSTTPNPIGTITSNPLAKYRSSAPKNQPTPEAGFGETALDYGFSSLGNLGHILDMSGSMVRDALAGDSMTDQITGWSEGKKTSGRDLLDMYGITSKNKEGWHWDDASDMVGDVAGFATEVALDPLTYMSLGLVPLLKKTLSPAGRIVKNTGLMNKVMTNPSFKNMTKRQIRSEPVGKLIDSLSVKDQNRFMKNMGRANKKTTLPDDFLKQPLGAKLGVGGPFGDPKKMFFKNYDILDRGLDKIDDVVYNKLGGKYLKSKFSKASGGFVKEYQQMVAARAAAHLTDSVYEAKMKIAPWKQATDKSGVFNTDLLSNDEVMENMRGFTNRLEDGTALPENMKWMEEFMEDSVDGAQKGLTTVYRETLDSAQKAGLDVADWNDSVFDLRYNPRLGNVWNKDAGFLSGSSALEVGATHGTSRNPDIGGVRTSILNDISVDKNYSGLFRGEGYMSQGMTKKFSNADSELSNQFGLKSHSQLGDDLYHDPKYKDQIGKPHEYISDKTKDDLYDYYEGLDPDLTPGEILQKVESEIGQVLETGNSVNGIQGIVRRGLNNTDFIYKKEQLIGSQVLESSVSEGMGITAQSTAAEIKNAYRKGLKSTDNEIIEHSKVLKSLMDESKDTIIDGIDTGLAMKIQGDFRGHVHSVAKWVGGVDPRHVEDMIPAFGLDPTRAVVNMVESTQEAIAHANVAHDIMVDSAKEITNLTGGVKTINEFISELSTSGRRMKSGKLNKKSMAERVSRTIGVELPPKELKKLLSRRTIKRLGKEVDSGDLKNLLDSDDWTDLADKLYLPEEIVSDLTEGLAGSAKKDGIWSKYWNIWKSTATVMRPGFHGRNELSARLMNWFNGLGFRTTQARALMRGDTPKDILRMPAIADLGITDPDEAADKVRQMMWATGALADQGEHLVADGIKQAGRVPGSTGKTMWSALDPAKDMIGKDSKYTANPLATMNPVNPLSKSDVSNNAWEAIGRNVSEAVESKNRIQGAYAGMMKGMDAGEAMSNVNRIQVDYGDLTKFEKDWVQRFIPFYSFDKGMVKYLSGELAERPGGPIGQVIRAQANAAGNNESMPEYIRDSASIPLSPTAEGEDKYLTGVGLMHENAINLVPGSRTPYQDVAFNIASRSNPLFKTLAEITTGQSLYQRGPKGGRDLQSLDPGIGRMVSNVRSVMGYEEPEKYLRSMPQFMEQGLGMSPLSSAVGEARAWTDTRRGVAEKAMNRFTGLRTTIVSEKRKRRVLLDKISVLKRDLGAGEGSYTYLPTSVKKNMSTLELAQYEKLKRLEKELKDQAKRLKAK